MPCLIFYVNYLIIYMSTGMRESNPLWEDPTANSTIWGSTLLNNWKSKATFGMHMMMWAKKLKSTPWKWWKAKLFFVSTVLDTTIFSIRVLQKSFPKLIKIFFFRLRPLKSLTFHLMYMNLCLIICLLLHFGRAIIFRR